MAINLRSSTDAVAMLFALDAFNDKSGESEHGGFEGAPPPPSIDRDRHYLASA